jgi:hypothetical protein
MHIIVHFIDRKSSGWSCLSPKFHPRSSSRPLSVSTGWSSATKGICFTAIKRGPPLRRFPFQTRHLPPYSALLALTSKPAILPQNECVWGRNMVTPQRITTKDVLAAMERVGTDPRKWPPQSQSTAYDVVHPDTGVRFPPKLILSEAAQIATGHELSRRLLRGGRTQAGAWRNWGFGLYPRLANDRARLVSRVAGWGRWC